MCGDRIEPATTSKMPIAKTTAQTHNESQDFLRKQAF